MLPLPGALPDMKAQSADYIELQNIYKAKARKDLAEMAETVRWTEKQLSRKAVDDKEIEAFCKGAAFVKLIHGRPVRVPSKIYDTKSDSFLKQWDDRAKFMCQELENEESLLPIHIAFLAYDWSMRPMGTAKDQDTEIIQNHNHDVMMAYCHDFLEQITASVTSTLDKSAILLRIENAVTELWRANCAELHNISALTGGMVAQEVIKVITKQYIPIDNVCVFDGVSSKTAVFKL